MSCQLVLAELSNWGSEDVSFLNVTRHVWAISECWTLTAALTWTPPDLQLLPSLCLLLLPQSYGVWIRAWIQVTSIVNSATYHSRVGVASWLADTGTIMAVRTWQPGIVIMVLMLLLSKTLLFKWQLYYDRSKYFPIFCKNFRVKKKYVYNVYDNRMHASPIH